MNLLRKVYYQNKALRDIYKSTAWLRRSFSSRKSEYQQEVISNLISVMQEDPVLKVEEFDGVFCFDVRSHIFLRLAVNRYYEPGLARLCKAYIDPERDVIDVGANIGLFTVMFAKTINPSRKILAIEPTNNASSRLINNMQRNQVSEQVIAFKGVASNISGSTMIKTILGMEEYSSIGNMSHPVVDTEAYATETVESKTLDELISLYSIDPGFVKVDVEGCEHLVFGGGQVMLENSRPIIISELSEFLLARNGSSAEEVIQTIRKHDYDIFDPIDPFSRPGLKEFGDIICFPKELNISNDQIMSI
jgi:FkbM family methyltransferase